LQFIVLIRNVDGGTNQAKTKSAQFFSRKEVFLLFFDCARHLVLHEDMTAAILTSFNVQKSNYDRCEVTKALDNTFSCDVADLR